LYRRKNSTLLTSAAGASAYFKGYCFYATSADVLGVSERLINEHSVVSREVVSCGIECKTMMKTDYAIATGNADLQKEMQMRIFELFYCIGHPKEIIVEEFNFVNPVKSDR
jgi:nicotinamide-nucleotide amidase